MSSEQMKPARLVQQFFPEISETVKLHGALDLACGTGRNGLFLARHNIPVVFADNNPAVLEKIVGESDQWNTRSQCWEVDFEDPGQQPLAGKKFDVILVFNYLHRPLIPPIRESLVAGGLLLYETFTVSQAAVGRPCNPDYLLEYGELRNWFRGWEILADFEGSESSPTRHFASLVARKPGL